MPTIKLTERGYVTGSHGSLYNDNYYYYKFLNLFRQKQAYSKRISVIYDGFSTTITMIVVIIVAETNCMNAK